jgi:type II secretory pathway component PulL
MKLKELSRASWIHPWKSSSGEKDKMDSVFIDWTGENLYLYTFKREGSRYTLTDSHSLKIEGELKPESLHSLVTTGIEDIYLSVPLNLLTLREQSFPFSGKEKIRDTLSYELEGILLGSPADYSIDYIITESNDTGSKVMAVCLERNRLKEIIDMLSSEGLEPKVITSLDLRLAEGKSERLFKETISDREIRAEAALEEILHPSINLRQDGLAYKGDLIKFSKGLRLTATLAIILLITLGATLTLRIAALNKEHKFLTNKIQGIYHKVFPEDRKIIDFERQFKGNVNMLMKKKAALGGIPVLDILRDIALHKDSGITLHEFNADGKNLIIKGIAESFKDVESLKNSLSSVFQEVKVVDSGATADKKINFTVVMREKSV